MKGYEWAESSVETLATEGIVNGKGNGMFDPGANVTREEFAKMIVSLFNFNVVSPNFKFTDVNKDSWYYEYVRRAHGCRVINGISDTLFGSGQNILRQDAVVMVYNALKYINRAENGDVIKNFNDESEVSDYARTAVLHAAEITPVNIPLRDFNASLKYRILRRGLLGEAVEKLISMANKKEVSLLFLEF